MKKIWPCCFSMALLSTVLASLPVQAVERGHGSSVQYVYMQANGTFVIGFNSSDSYCGNINNPKYYYAAVGQNGVTAEGINKMYAAALTALVAKKTIYIVYDDATTSCYINRLQISD